MKTECEWLGKSNFVASINGFKVQMDAARPFGEEAAPTPKQLVLAAICGCTGMDVVGYLKKHRQQPANFTMSAEAALTESDVWLNGKSIGTGVANFRPGAQALHA